MMGNLSFTRKLCISVCWGLLLMYTAAERQYFIISQNSSWVQARNHCQVCYEEMVTLTPENTYIVARMINSDHWIGLRKYINYNGTYNDTTEPNNSTNTSPNISGTPWTLWANGDPLVFQNWYPGYPVFKSLLPKIDCCSCSCTCPAPIQTTTNPPTVSSVTSQKNGNATRSNTSTVIYDNMTDFTSLLEFENATTHTMNLTNKANVTQSWKSTAVLNVHATDSSWTTTPQLPIVSTCERSPMLPPVIPENNKNYIENSCVVILGFGPWAEKVCSEKKPFICYEDRFMGRVNVSNITSSSVSLQWDQGPGDLSHYRLQVTAADWNLTVELQNLNFELNNLTAGTRYNIQVFPVKCKRDLNPQNSSFYTIPGEVENLTVTNFTETSVSLSWKKPNGNYDFFQVTAKSLLDQPHSIIWDNITTDHFVFDKLVQGNNYTFIFITGVKDRTMWSQERKTLACTRPAKVTMLEVFGNSDTWLQLKWTPPDGNYEEFIVKVKDGDMSDLNATVTLPHSSKLNEVHVSGLPKGSMIKLFVSAFSNCSLQGETENITTYTAPGPISNLSLQAQASSITADWSFEANNGNVSKFEAELFLNRVSQQIKTTEDEKKQITFKNLKTATNYTVAVYAVINKLRSPEKTCSIFTLPSQPTEAKVLNKTNNSLTFVWKPPVNSSATDYNCTLNSTFWGMFQTHIVSDTKCSFTNLFSGSNYSFQVYTLSDGRISEPTGCLDHTVEDKVEISLSMMCASEQSLYCDGKKVREDLFQELKRYINDELQGNVFHEVQGATFQRT